MTARVRTVLVGAGGITRAWLSSAALRERVEIVGVVDLREEAAHALVAKWELGTAAVGSDLAAMLAELRPTAVFDCTVPAAHHAVTMCALRHGCHVLGEKPLAATLEQAREMVAAAGAAQRIYAVIQNRRYMTAIRRARAFLASGALGRVHSVCADFFIGADFGGFRATMDHVLLLDMAIHSFDQARLLAGVDPLAVTCQEWNPPGSAYRHGANAIATFTMSDGVVFSYRGSWTAAGCNTSWECAWRIIGERGTLCWDGGDGFRAEVRNDLQQASAEAGGGLIRTVQEVPVPELPGLEHRGHDGVIDDFLDAIGSGREPETVCHDNIKSLQMVLLAIASAERGGAPVTLTALG